MQNPSPISSISKSLRHHAYSIQYGTQKIEFDLEYSDRKTLGIEVHPDQNVLVKAPIGSNLATIQAKVTHRASWITRQKKQFATYAPTLPAPKYVSGESYRYLGRQCRLKVIPADAAFVKLWAGRLEVHTSDPENPIHIKQLVANWYRDRAQQVFSDRYQHCLNQVKKIGITHDRGFKLRSMAKRWGSCSVQGQITLNPLLVMAPKDCIDYVIIHELCHLKYHNHSSRFYQLLATVIPDWQIHKNYLNTHIELRELE